MNGEYVMRKAWLLLILALLAVAVPASAWEMDEFVIYLWGLPGGDDLNAKAKALSDAGLTVVNWDADKLDILGRYGLKGMVHDATPELARSLRDNPTSGVSSRRRTIPRVKISTYSETVQGV